MIMLLSVSVDMWSVGCIMAELLTRKVLFPGENRIRFAIYFVGVVLKDTLMPNVM